MNEDKGVRYHRIRRRSALAGGAVGAIWVATLAFTGVGDAIDEWARGIAAAAPAALSAAVALVLFVTAAVTGLELLSLPVVFHRTFLLERRYGLSSESFPTWLADHAKALALGLPLTIGMAAVVVLSAHVAGGFWWLLATCVFGGAIVALGAVAPTVLMPLFYRFTPLENAQLRDRLMTLSERAGVRVLGTFEWGLGEKTSRANAALVGIGRTRRILVSDTLLKDYSDDEIEVILAHEMAHHVHHDVWSGLAVESAILLAALWAAHLAAPQPGVRALPLVALTAGAVSLLLSPLGLAWSRHNERRADRYALALTQRTDAFVSAMRRLGAQNLAEEHPSRLVLWLFHTHPPIDDRIAAARAFK